MFGAVSFNGRDFELGYSSMDELNSLKSHFAGNNIFVPSVELDLYYDNTQTFGEITGDKTSQKGNSNIEEVSDNDNIQGRSTTRNNRIQEEQYKISEGKKSYWGISFYENDCMMEQKRFVPSGDELYKYELDNTGHGFYTYFKEGNTSEKIIEKEVYRRFNSIGFLEYEEKKPYNSEVGDYSYTTVEILSEPDELFNSQFKFSD